MGRMVADSKLVLNHLGHAASSPDIAQKTISFGTLLQQFNQLRELVWAQGGRTPRYGLISQSSGAVAGSTRQPLADRTLGHTQSLSDVALGPTLLIKRPGALASAFAPTSGPVTICRAHRLQLSISRPTSMRSLCAYL